MKYALIKNNIVEQMQPYHEDGFVEVPNNTVCGMIKNGDNFDTPPPTPQEPVVNLMDDIEAILDVLSPDDFAKLPAELKQRHADKKANKP